MSQAQEDVSPAEAARLRDGSAGGGGGGAVEAPTTMDYPDLAEAVSRARGIAAGSGKD
jgi:hypothetical protein